MAYDQLDAGILAGAGDDVGLADISSGSWFSRLLKIGALHTFATMSLMQISMRAGSGISGP